MDVNNIGKGLIKLAEVMGKNKHGKLELLTLKNSDISKKDLHEFFKTLGNESALKTLILERNELERANFEEDLKQFPSLEVHF